MRPHILVIDDDASLREALTVVLEEEFAVHTAATGEEGLALLQRLRIPVIILDLHLPGMPGLEVLTHLKALDPQIEVLILTATREAAMMDRAMRAGASDYLTKPFDIERLLTRVRTAFARYRARQPPLLALLVPPLGGGLVGQRPPMQQVLVLLHAVADTSTTVASEGVLAQAHTGSLFLDEVSRLSPAAQAALLRMLQEREGMRLGSTQFPPVDVRLIAATTQDLRQMVRAGTFREDVFHHLDVMPLTVPPLHEHPTDIPLLVAHFLEKYNQGLGRQVPGLTAAALAALCASAWPGNVCELAHLMRRLVTRSAQRVLEVGEVHALLQ
jgi:two-component system, NtrC family, response regulator AtoC